MTLAYSLSFALPPFAGPLVGLADEMSRVYRLSRARLDAMERKAPEVCSVLHALIIRVPTDRLGFAGTEISAVQR